MKINHPVKEMLDLPDWMWTDSNRFNGFFETSLRICSLIILIETHRYENREEKYFEVKMGWSGNAMPMTNQHKCFDYTITGFEEMCAWIDERRLTLAALLL